MDIRRVRFLREVLLSNRHDHTTPVIEFSYDAWYVHRQRFFGVPDEDQAQARKLYLEWGGSRAEGSPFGSTVSRPEWSSGI